MILLDVIGLKIEAVGVTCGSCRFQFRKDNSYPKCRMFRADLDYIRNGDGTKHYEGVDPLPTVGRCFECIAATQKHL